MTESTRRARPPIHREPDIDQILSIGENSLDITVRTLVRDIADK
jgi:hypothetical protein